MRETLTISTEEGNLLDIRVMTSRETPPTAGIFVESENLILLGSERWEEWQDISGNDKKQRKFIQKLERLTLKQLEHENRN